MLFALSDEAIEKEPYFYFPVYALIHGEVTLALNPFSDKWDASKVGYIVVNKKHVLDETKESAFNLAKSYIEQWNYYLAGHTYCIQIYKKEYYDKVYRNANIAATIDYDLVSVDNCGGFVGDTFEYNGIDDYLSDNGFKRCTQGI